MSCAWAWDSHSCRRLTHHANWLERESHTGAAGVSSSDAPRRRSPNEFGGVEGQPLPPLARSKQLLGCVALGPHLDLLVTDGGFRPDGTFIAWPVDDTARSTEAFRRAVLRLFVRLALFDAD